MRRHLTITDVAVEGVKKDTLLCREWIQYKRGLHFFLGLKVPKMCQENLTSPNRDLTALSAVT